MQRIFKLALFTLCLTALVPTFGMRIHRTKQKPVERFITAHQTRVELSEALIETAQYGSVTACKKLLDKGADLHYRGTLKEFGTILKHTDNNTLHCSTRYTTAFICAAQNGHQELCELFLKHSPSLMDSQLSSALEWATAFGRQEICELLIEKIFTDYKELKKRIRTLLCSLRSAYKPGEYQQFRCVLKKRLVEALAEERQKAIKIARDEIGRMSFGAFHSGMTKQDFLNKYCDYNK